MPNLNPITRKEAILNGNDVTPMTREEHFAKNAVSGGVPTPTEDDNGKVLTAGADGTASWQETGGIYQLSNTVKLEVYTLIGAVITDILTNSKTVPVKKRSTLTHSGVADDIAILRSAAAAFMSGRQVAIPVADNTLARALEAYLGDPSGVEIQFFIPTYYQEVPGVGDCYFSLSLIFQGASDSVVVDAALQAITVIS